MHSYRFTVFTPTFNRADTLPRVYESLVHQTYRDFEWLIVDDGSTDGTKCCVEAWKQESRIDIVYVYQPNQGKHVATNRAVCLARGEFFLTLDSDDACVPNALERLNCHWESIPEKEQNAFSAVTSLCVSSRGAPIGSRFPISPLDSNSAELFYKFHVRGEKWGFQRTDVMKRFPFPEVIGEKFVTEALVWRAIGRQYKTRFVNEYLRIYSEPPRQENKGRLTSVGPAAAAEGFRLYNLDTLNHDIEFLRFAPFEFFKAAANYVRFSFHRNVGLKKQYRGLRSVVARGLWTLGVVPGAALFLVDRKFH